MFSPQKNCLFFINQVVNFASKCCLNFNISHYLVLLSGLAKVENDFNHFSNFSSIVCCRSLSISRTRCLIRVICTLLVSLLQLMSSCNIISIRSLDKEQIKNKMLCDDQKGIKNDEENELLLVSIMVTNPVEQHQCFQKVIFERKIRGSLCLFLICSTVKMVEIIALTLK